MPEFKLHEFESGDCMLWCNVSVLQHPKNDNNQLDSLVYQDPSLSLDSGAINAPASTEWRGQMSVALHPSYQASIISMQFHGYVLYLSTNYMVDTITVHKSVQS
jgi:hypothetical protein